LTGYFVLLLHPCPDPRSKIPQALLSKKGAFELKV
jgi:hypothetical protein